MSDGIYPPNDTPKKPPKRPKLERSVKLPTPPPDPWENHPKFPKTPYPSKDGPGEASACEKSERSPSGVSENDREIFDYIESLHQGLYTRSSSTFGPAIVSEEAFDHLEKLYKLMEQMLELRKQNVKLHRRIRDLEHLNNLEKIHINPIAIDEDYPDLEKDTAFAEAILESILQDPKNRELQKQKSLRPSILRRHRSGSATDKQVTLEGTGSLEKDEKERERAKERVGLKSDKPVSKWTKVKAAFRWEKASNVGDSKSQDSGIHVPLNYEIARYLRVPSTSDDMGHSPGDSGAGISTPGSMSSASSCDDLRMGRAPCDDFRSSDEENPHNYIPHSKDYRRKSSSQKYHRTPWAKMKEIIHTRNSLRKKHRLSAASDDIQIDVEFCSDNEDVFEAEDTGNKSTNMSLSPSPNIYTNSSTSPCSSDIRPEIVERYQRVLAEDSTSDSEARPSRWTRVRKAFLSHDRSPKASQSTQNKERSDEANVEQEIQRNYKILQNRLSLEFQEKIHEWERTKQNSPGVSNPSSSCGFSEDNRDPFYVRKMEELNKIKNNSSSDKYRRVPMTREYELPPDFKKKLEEWEKIKKTSSGPKKKLGEVPKWKSLGGPRSSDQSPVFEYPVLSEDFRKKLEEWRRIKASGGPLAYAEQKKLKEKSPSPKLSRKNSSPKQSKKGKDPNKEFHWFEKEMGKIEKEKQQLERERQRFIEREERLSKLRRSMLGGPPKKEVLIHTPSGFHRFEGISRKFTQKLYEWEKSQGIAPEASTFALLSSSSFTPELRINGNKERNSSVRKTRSYSNKISILQNENAHNTPTLARSKSADSIAISALNLTCPLLSGHPSSLSLNDMDELERECLADSKSSSMQYLMESYENYLEDNLDMDEPEAVLVEVEDYEEETAEPLHVSCVERRQLPVYQRQDFKPLCESETIVVPKVRRSESARAQTNYDLMENIVKLLTELQVTEDEIRCLAENKCLQDEQNKKTFKFLNELQDQSIKKLSEKLLKLQEANNSVASSILKDEEQIQTHLNDILESVQDVSTDMLQLTEKMEKTILSRLSHSGGFYQSTIFELIKDIRFKIADLRRHLSYICAATDSTMPTRKKSTGNKLEVKNSLSNESGTSDNSRRNSEKERRFLKVEISSANTNCSVSQGAVKKRIRYRQKTLEKSLVDTDDEEEGETEPPKNARQHKKLARTRSVSEGGLPPKLDTGALVKQDGNTSHMKTEYSPSDSAVTLFVKTTRKLFTPLVETSLAKSSTEPNISSKTEENNADKKMDPSINMSEPAPQSVQKNPTVSKSEAVTSLPPLPASPVPQRKVYKEVSPGIRMIMAKYNQSIEASGTKSGGSSGSNSPIAWRSPVSERRVKVQTERYEEELNKLSPLLSERKEVQKSSSASFLASPIKQVTIPARRTSLQYRTSPSNPSSTNSQQPTQSTGTASFSEGRRHLTLDIDLANTGKELKDSSFSPEVRMRKIQKAKEEFLKAPLSAPSYVTEVALQFPQRNRLSQVSVESESSCDQSTMPGSLVKSVSAGMINIDADTYKRIHPEYHAEGYLSLPRQNKKSGYGILGGKSAFSTIASKFRKVKMRRGKAKEKDKDKQVVETLCRQSLVVDINPSELDDHCARAGSGVASANNNGDVCRGRHDGRGSLDGEGPASSSRSPLPKSNSWIMRSLFKK